MFISRFFYLLFVVHILAFSSSIWAQTDNGSSVTSSVDADAADQEQGGDKCCPKFPSFCSLPDFCGFRDCLPKIKCNQIYIGTSVSRIMANKFKGWGASVRIGRYFSLDEFTEMDFKGHALELEVGYFSEKASKSSLTNVQGLVPTIMAAYLFEKRDVDVDLVPVMLNYRYHGSMAEWFESACWSRFRWYIGAGLGFVYMSSVNNEVKQLLSNMSNVVEDLSPAARKDSTFSLAAQLFGGIGYQLLDRLEIYSGIRVLLMKDRQFGSDTLTSLKMAQGHFVWDVVGMEWKW